MRHTHPGAAGPEQARTLLFVPGSSPERFEKAAGSGADLVVVDLEDAVAGHDKAAARENVVAWLRTGGRAAVRVNADGSPHHDEDVSALTGLPGLLAMMLPMADDPAALAGLHARLGPGVALVPLVETATGLLSALDLGRAPGVVRLAFGHLDFAADVDADTGAEAMLMARSALVVASRAAGLPGPVDGVTTVLDDADVVRAETLSSRRLGFTGKLCVHPRQVGPVNEAMSPSEEQVAWARRVLDAAVSGVARLDGQMVDAPVIARARAVVSRIPDERRRP